MSAFWSEYVVVGLGVTIFVSVVLLLARWLPGRRIRFPGDRQ